jgi:hypothetical protein
MALAHHSRDTPFIEETTLSERSQQTLANLALEGITPSPALMADIKLFDAGKITLDELLARGLKRAQTEKLPSGEISSSVIQADFSSSVTKKTKTATGE